MQEMAASKTIFQQVSIERGDGQPPATLLRMAQASGSISLVMRQVHLELCPYITLSQFRFTASKQRHAAIKTLQGPDCLWIFKHGATSSHSHQVNIISLATAIGACKAHDVHDVAVASLESLRVPGSYTVLAQPEHMLKMNCTPDVNPTSLLVPLPLPSTLPPSPVPTPKPKQRYSLQIFKPHLAKGVVVCQQLTELKTWVTTPIQLDRQGPALQQRSWENLLSNVWLFLGFCWKWMGIQQPCLQHYLHPHLVASYMSFHIAMQHKSNTIKHHVTTSLKVLAWWSTKPGGHDKGLQLMREQWLPNLSAQVGRALPQPKKTADTLPTAQRLLLLIHTERQKVLQQLAEEGMTARLARSLHDLGLVSTIFGYLPPIRLTCIRTLVLPTYQGPCHKPDCIHGSSCHGNVLQNKGTTGLHMHLAHHKNEAAWGRAPISFQVPQQLAELLVLHVTQGHKLLTEYLGLEEEVHHVFVDHRGKPFNDSNFTVYWDRVMASMGLSPPISPSMCRQVFVHERRSEERVDGPKDRGAAMVMGHSLAQWSKWYDLDFHAREAQEAVNDMACWREELLSLATAATTTAKLSAPPLGPATQAQQQVGLGFASSRVLQLDDIIQHPMDAGCQQDKPSLSVNLDAEHGLERGDVDSDDPNDEDFVVELDDHH